MKKILLLCSVLLMTVLLTACGNSLPNTSKLKEEEKLEYTTEEILKVVSEVKNPKLANNGVAVKVAGEVDITDSGTSIKIKANGSGNFGGETFESAYLGLKLDIEYSMKMTVFLPMTMSSKGKSELYIKEKIQYEKNVATATVNGVEEKVSTTINNGEESAFVTYNSFYDQTDVTKIDLTDSTNLAIYKKDKYFIVKATMDNIDGLGGVTGEIGMLPTESVKATVSIIIKDNEVKGINYSVIGNNEKEFTISFTQSTSKPKFPDFSNYTKPTMN